MTAVSFEAAGFAGEARAAEAALHSVPSIVDVMSIRAATHPDELAVLDAARDTRITYGKLQTRAVEVAARLVASGVTAGALVALPVDQDLTRHAVVHLAVSMIRARPMAVATLDQFTDGRPVGVEVPDSGRFEIRIDNLAGPVTGAEDVGDALFDAASGRPVCRTGAELRQVFAPRWPKLLPMLRSMAYTVDAGSLGSVLLWQYWRGRGGVVVTDPSVGALAAAADRYRTGAVVLTKSQYRALGPEAVAGHDLTSVREVDISSVSRVTADDVARIAATFPQAAPAGLPALDARLRLLAARAGSTSSGARTSPGAALTSDSSLPPLPSLPALAELVGEVPAAYVDLLATVLTRWIFDCEYVAVSGENLYRKQPIDRAARAIGRDWPADAETMVGLHRLRHLATCVATVVREDVPGDLLEAGVWRGGSCILMRAVLRAVADGTRSVWAADSYRGFPEQDFTLAAEADATDTSVYQFPLISVGLPVVRQNFARFGLLDERVRFVPGWFHETLPGLDVDTLSLLRIDGDLYDSTWAPLEAMYPRLAPGGFCIVDDYGDVTACRDAVDEYRRSHGVTEPVTWIDTDAVYWRKAR